jgi:protein-disulfide isomerase
VDEQTIDVNLAPEEPKQPDVIVLPRVFFNYVVIAITFLIVGVIIGATTFGTSGGVIDEATLEKTLRSVLGNMDLNATGSVDRFELVDDDPYLGPEDAPVVIVEFSAFACPYCGRHHRETFPAIIENYGQYVRYVYRDFPVINPPVSVPAALAANCANDQGKFWEYATTLYNNQDKLGEAFFVDTASQLGLDMTEWMACYQEQRYMSEIDSDTLDGRVLNIGGTPGFFVNGQYVSGAQPYEFFERLILRELQRAGIDVNSTSSGT